MLTIEYDVDKTARAVRGIRLDASQYSGNERPAKTLKDTLTEIHVTNPCVVFSRRMKSGEYDPNSDPEDIVTSIAESVNFFSNMFVYEKPIDLREVPGVEQRPYLSILHLLNNSLQYNFLQRERIIDLIERYGN